MVKNTVRRSNRDSGRKAVLLTVDRHEVHRQQLALIESREFRHGRDHGKSLSMAREAYDRGANLVLFPEASNIGYFVLDGSRGVKENLALAKGMADT